MSEINIDIKIAILVVLYNKEIDESKTLTTLLNNFNHEESITLYIVNNGPRKINLSNSLSSRFESKFRQVIFKEYTENKPLSKIYNEFINNCCGDYFLIFDDDSEPQESYFDMLKNIKYDIVFPRIKSLDDGFFYYPCSNDSTISKDGYLNISSTMSIASGLVISKKAISLMKKYFNSVFDERYALYGIDTSFIFRLRDVNSKERDILTFYSTGLILHSLSRTSTELSEFRTIERLCDVAITTRFYSRYYGYGVYIRKLLSSILKRKPKYLLILFSCFIRGRHPRC